MKTPPMPEPLYVEKTSKGKEKILRKSVDTFLLSHTLKTIHAFQIIPLFSIVFTVCILPSIAFVVCVSGAILIYLYQSEGGYITVFFVTITAMPQHCCDSNPDEIRLFWLFSNCSNSLGDLEFLCSTAKPDNQAFDY